MKLASIYPKKLAKNDKMVSRYIWIFSIVVFLAVTVLDRLEVNVDLGFDPHIFAMISALINGIVAILLILALYQIKNGNIEGHRKTMLSTMYLSVFFLVFYILHHLFTGETRFGDLNHDGVLSPQEITDAGTLRYVYYFLISTHIILAGLVMPFVLFSAYRALSGEIMRHKKLVRYTFPIWLYVAVTGVVVYILIRPYYEAYAG